MKAKTNLKGDREKELQRMPRDQIIAVWRKALGIDDAETIKPTHMMISDILAKEFSGQTR